jgi:hypothetical protein
MEAGIGRGGAYLSVRRATRTTFGLLHPMVVGMCSRTHISF